MPLTPEDVSNKRFTPVRLREGYDMSEVDQFLDEVEAELGRLVKENDELRSKVGAATTEGEGAAAQDGKREDRSGDGAAAPAGGEDEAPASSAVAADDAVSLDKDEEAGTTTVAVTSSREAITVRTVPEASNAAARLLEIATRNADELVEEAQAEADTIVGSARTKAERLESESKERAEKTEGDARERSQKLDEETAERRERLFADLEQERDRLGSEVEDLRSFEREYRSRLKNYFTQQLAELEEGEGAGGGQEPDTPQRLKSVLGDD